MIGDGSDAAYKQHQAERVRAAMEHDATVARQVPARGWPFNQQYRYRDAVARAYENRDRDELARLATLAEQHIAELSFRPSPGA